MPHFLPELLQPNRLLIETFLRIDNHLLQDRIRLESAGLCNRIIADGAYSETADAVLRGNAFHRASSYLNIEMDAVFMNLR